MIECLPTGICSWDYILRGGGHEALVEFWWMSECGRLTIDEKRFAVEKEGLLSGRWRMESLDGLFFTASKTSPFTRTFEIYGAGVYAKLHAASAFGRTMILEAGGRQSVIAPAHPFTRRAKMSGSCGDFRLAAFAFWLSGLTWRRAANSGS